MKTGDVIQHQGRLKIVLPVSQKDLDEGINADTTGLHCFYGLWYGEDRLDHNSYGKIESLPETDYLVIGNVINLGNIKL